MKKYGLFIGEQYYNGQGMDDFVDSYESIDEAKLAAVPALENHSKENGCYSWMQISDMETGTPLLEVQHPENGDDWTEVVFDEK